MIKKATILLIVITFSTTFSFAADVNMKPGKWEISTKVEMTGMAMEMPPMTHTQCITKEDLVPQNKDYKGDDQCKVKSTKIKGNTVSWEIECTGEQGKTTGNGEITYSGTTFKGETLLKMPQNMTMKSIMTGKRVGECKQ